MPGIFDPLLPQSAIDPLQKRLERRSLDQSPGEAALMGFGSGALEGLRDLTSPLSLAGMIPGGAAAKLLSFAPKAARAIRPTMGLLNEAPIAQAMPQADEVAELLGSLQQNLSKVPQAGTRIPRPNLPEFDPVTAPVAPSLRGLRSAAEDPFDAQRVTKYLSKVR